MNVPRRAMTFFERCCRNQDMCLYQWFLITWLVIAHLKSGQISEIPRPELRGFWGSSHIKPPFRVT